MPLKKKNKFGFDKDGVHLNSPPATPSSVIFLHGQGLLSQGGPCRWKEYSPVLHAEGPRLNPVERTKQEVTAKTSLCLRFYHSEWTILILTHHLPLPIRDRQPRLAMYIQFRLNRKPPEWGEFGPLFGHIKPNCILWSDSANWINYSGFFTPLYPIVPFCM